MNRIILIDENNQAEEIRPGLLAIRQVNTITHETKTIYLTFDSLKWLADLL